MARSARRVWVALALSAAGAAAFAPAPAGGLRLRQASRDNQQPSAPRPRKLAVQGPPPRDSAHFRRPAAAEGVSCLGALSLVDGALTLAEGASVMSVLSALVTALLTAPFKYFQACMGAHPIVTECVVAIGLYVLGKMTSDKINGQNLAQKRVLTKWGILGFCDGFFTGIWYRYLETAFAGYAAVQKATAMTLLSSIFYSPLYCVGFLLLRSALEGQRPAIIGARFKRDFLPMCKASFSTWGPFNIVLFGVVPIHQRLVVSMATHYVYLVFLAMWDSGFLQDFLSRSRMFWRKTLAGKGTGAAAAKLRGAELTTGAVAVAAAVAKSSSDGGSAQVEITDKAAAVMVSPGFEGLMAGVEDNMYPPESKVISSATIISAAAAASAATTSTQAVTGAVTAVTSEFTEFGAPGPAAVPQPGPPAAPPVAIGAAATQAVGAPPAVTDAVEENEVIGDAGPRIQTNPGSSQ
eukprot:Tamp_14887.p1 GENE.Tamp_14887~~Tamp_14887.p1  ORF type:complete len:465 (+),score=67.07 Tamp_14887:40-1434(+)